MSTIRTCTERDVCVICGGIDEMPSGDCARCLALESLDLLARAYAWCPESTRSDIGDFLRAHGRLGGET